MIYDYNDRIPVISVVISQPCLLHCVGERFIYLCVNETDTLAKSYPANTTERCDDYNGKVWSGSLCLVKDLDGKKAKEERQLFLQTRLPD